jgi:cyclopropane fatty-acyl-phospholipid synthase-like methyltransferase
MHEKSIKYYDLLAKKINDPTEIRNKSEDSSALDFSYLIEMIPEKSIILDLGSGTGLLVNKLCNAGFYVHAVERCKEFANFIQINKKIIIHIADLRVFEPERSFNYVTAFGVLNFFTVEEAFILYKKIFSWILPGGRLILKHQMGVIDDVLIDGFSKELNTDYFSMYRAVDHELELLSRAGFKIDQVDDIYGNRINRWANTRFFAVVATRPS